MTLGKTVGEIENTMSSAELTEWIAYAGIDPLPDAHWDAANIAFHVNRSMGGKGRFEDFLPQTERKRRRSEPKVKLDAEQTRGLLSRLFGRPTDAGDRGRGGGRGR